MSTKVPLRQGVIEEMGAECMSDFNLLDVEDKGCPKLLTGEVGKFDFCYDMDNNTGFFASLEIESQLREIRVFWLLSRHPQGQGGGRLKVSSM